MNEAPAPQPPELLDPVAPGPGLEELVSETLETPSIRRRRLSVSATASWLVAQPVTANVGTLPGGVVELTDAPAAEPELDAELEEEEEEEEEEEPEPDVVGAVPIEPPRVVSEASFGSTRPNSWKVWAQSKRASTSDSTALMRAWRIATKAV